MCIRDSGKKKKVKLATDVIRRIKKDIRDGKHPVVQLAYPSAQLKKIMDDRKAARAGAVMKGVEAKKSINKATSEVVS